MSSGWYDADQRQSAGSLSEDIQKELREGTVMFPLYILMFFKIETCKTKMGRVSTDYILLTGT